MVTSEIFLTATIRRYNSSTEEDKQNVVYNGLSVTKMNEILTNTLYYS